MALFLKVLSLVVSEAYVLDWGAVVLLALTCNFIWTCHSWFDFALNSLGCFPTVFPCKTELFMTNNITICDLTPSTFMAVLLIRADISLVLLDHLTPAPCCSFLRVLFPEKLCTPGRVSRFSAERWDTPQSRRKSDTKVALRWFMPSLNTQGLYFWVKQFTVVSYKASLCYHCFCIETRRPLLKPHIRCFYVTIVSSHVVMQAFVFRKMTWSLRKLLQSRCCFEAPRVLKSNWSNSNSLETTSKSHQNRC